MLYPKFLKKNSTIGISAPSAGVGRKIEKYEESLNILKKEGYRIVETPSVRVNNIRSTTARKRGKELNSLISDENIDMVIMATGGDYMYEVLPFIDFEAIKNNPKWLMGYSDPTNVLYTVTTRYDIATLYGFNGSSYDNNNFKYQRDNLEILKGNIVTQNSYRKYQKQDDYVNDILEFNGDVKWLCKENTTISGRLIGGCFEIISNILGTEYDYTNEFIERHKDEGIVWFFDVYSMNADDFYLRLLQMKYAGYFNNTKGVLVGRVAMPNENPKGMTYKKALDLALKDIPHISEMDIGHTSPMMTLINGSMVKVNYRDNRGSIRMILK